MVYKFFNKKSAGGAIRYRNKLHKPIIRKLKKYKAYSYLEITYGVRT